MKKGRRYEAYLDFVSRNLGYESFAYGATDVSYFFCFSASLIWVAKRPATGLDDLSVEADLSFLGLRTSRLLRTWPFAMMETFLPMSGRFRKCTEVCSVRFAHNIYPITNIDKRRMKSSPSGKC